MLLLHRLPPSSEQHVQEPTVRQTLVFSAELAHAHPWQRWPRGRGRIVSGHAPTRQCHLSQHLAGLARAHVIALAPASHRALTSRGTCLQRPRSLRAGGGPSRIHAHKRPRRVERGQLAGETNPAKVTLSRPRPISRRDRSGPLPTRTRWTSCLVNSWVASMRSTCLLREISLPTVKTINARSSTPIARRVALLRWCI